ncbi:tetratricopeptide repeat protein 28-like [Pocillopora verrucosa]|uniref:tetratricopeptide repeat protein 28-like n=1 Tax=Pocillopora verrucosa TaxID=203993 RepID=UPI00334283B1
MAESDPPTAGKDLDLNNELAVTASNESQVTSSETKLGVYDDLLRERAKECLEEGNKKYKQGETKEAINFYTEGLQMNCKDKRLNAKLYSNRAAAYFHLENYEECLNDATVAVQLEPTLVKAIKKGASACVELSLLEEIRSWLQMGLAVSFDECFKCNAHLFLTRFKIDERKTFLVPVEIGKAKEGIRCNRLGKAYGDIGQFKTAIKYHQRGLQIAKEVGDKKTAIEYHQRHLEIAKEVGDKAGEGTSYGNLGCAYYGLGQFKTAIEYHQRHLEIAKEVGDKAGEGTSYGNLGCAYDSLGQFKTAIEYHQRNLDFAKEVGDKAGEGRSYGNLGCAYDSLGQFKTAIEYHQRNLDFAKEVGDKAGEGTSYGNLGCAYYSLGQFKTAIEYHQRRLEIAKEVGDKAREGKSYGNLGCAYYSLGQFKTAIEYHQRGLEIAKEVGDKAGEGTGYGNLGCTYYSLGQFETAIEYHQRGLEIAKEVGDKAREGKSYGNLGCTYDSLGEFKTAIEYHQRHLEIAKEVGDKAEEGRSYGNLGCAYDSLRQFKKAIEYHQRHLEIAKEVGDKAGKGKSYRNLGCAYYSLGQFKTAIEYHQRGLEIAKEVGDKAGEAFSLSLLGKSLESQGKLRRAFDCFHSSVEVFDSIRASLHFNDQWKIIYRDQHKSAYIGLWRVNLIQGEVVDALLTAEKGRAQALRDLLTLKYQPRDFSFALLSFIPSSTIFIAISGPYVHFWVVLSDDNIQSRQVHVNNYKYQKELEFFIKQLTKTALKEVGSRDAVACENPPHYWPKPEKVANDMMQVDARNSQLSALQKLYDIIVTPIADLIKGNELTFVPEGPFCLVPYAALEDSNSTYLSDSFRIRVLPSLTTLRLINDSPAEFHMKSGALLVGDPCFKEIMYQGRRLVQLPGAREEAEMIGRILSISPLTGEMATKGEVLKRLSSVALVHIAAHGKMETGEVILAPNTTRETPQPQEKDYLLTMKDVLETGLRAQLVVLSCCHSARGEVMAEGVVGIARSFLGAGARSVVVALWALDDEGTLEFMSFFYDALAKGKKASEALNQAMRCMRESGTFKEVKYWAPFVLIGDDVKLDIKDI